MGKSLLTKMNKGNLSHLTKHNLNTVLTFGKYKGSTIKEVTEFDSDYILFLEEREYIKPDLELMKQINRTREDKKYLNKDLEWEEIFGTYLP